MIGADDEQATPGPAPRGNVFAGRAIQTGRGSGRPQNILAPFRGFGREKVAQPIGDGKVGTPDEKGIDTLHRGDAGEVLEPFRILDLADQGNLLAGLIEMVGNTKRR